MKGGKGRACGMMCSFFVTGVATWDLFLRCIIGLKRHDAWETQESDGERRGRRGEEGRKSDRDRDRDRDRWRETHKQKKERGHGTDNYTSLS